MASVMIVGAYAPSLLNFRGPLIREMCQRGHAVIAVAPRFDEKTRGALVGMGATCEEIYLDRTGISPLRDLRTLVSIFRAIYRVRPDALLLYTIKPVIYGSIVAQLLRVRRVYSMITGLGYVFVGSPGTSMLRRMVVFLYRRALRGNSAVFFQNPDDMGLFEAERLVPRQARKVLINGSGVDLSHFRPCALPDESVFLLIGRLLIDKGIREYVAAARLVRRSHPNAQFLLVGWLDGNPGSLSREEIDGYEREGLISYLGPSDDVRKVIPLCRIYVLPSYREGTPRTVLEAMAMGRPIITTDAPGCRETVRHGFNGLQVPVKDAAALASAMVKMLDERMETNRMADNSLALVREKYDCNLVNTSILSTMGL